MKHPPHPGRSIRHDCLEPLDLCVTGAAGKLGVSRRQLSAVLNGHAGISPETAIRLDKAVGGGAETWLRLQTAFDLAQAMKQVDRIKVERVTKFCVDENFDMRVVLSKLLLLIHFSALIILISGEN